MKKHLIILSLLFFAACNNAQESSDTQDSITETNTAEEAQTETICYLSTADDEHQDSSIIKMVIDSNKVTGEMKYLPWQKDASVGTITGTKDGNMLELEWTYWQEGMEAKESVVLEMGDNSITQIPAYRNEQGELILEMNDEYKTEYKHVDCSVLPDRNY